MNIEKLAKHLKEFTLDEINMIAECDCKTELAHLLNSNKIVFEHGMYKYRESLKNSCLNYRVFVQNATLRKNLKSVEKDLTRPKQSHKNLTPEFIKQIQKDVLGWNENI